MIEEMKRNVRRQKDMVQGDRGGNECKGVGYRSKMRENIMEPARLTPIII